MISFSRRARWPAGYDQPFGTYPGRGRARGWCDIKFLFSREQIAPERVISPGSARGSAGLQQSSRAARPGLSFDSGALSVGVASRGRGSERPATRAGWSPAAGD